MATWGPNSEELALPDATAGGTELPAGLAPAAVPVVAVVPVVAAVPVVAGAEVLPAVADTGLAVVPWLPAVAAEAPAVPLVAPGAVVLAPAAVVPVLATGAVTAESVVVAAAVPA